MKDSQPEFGVSDLPTEDLRRIAHSCEDIADEMAQADRHGRAQDLHTAAVIVREYAGISILALLLLSGCGGPGEVTSSVVIDTTGAVIGGSVAR